MIVRLRTVGALFVAGAMTLGGCAPLPEGAAAGGGSSQEGAEGLLVPPGYGSLRQDEISVTLLAGPVRLRVTPLEEWVIRLAAPDTYQRLSGLRQQHAAAAGGEASWFLVSFFSEAQGQSFAPEDVELENRGRSLRPGDIRSVTAAWGTRRLTQRQAETAVYRYAGGIDLTQALTVTYGGIRSDRWTSILRTLESERARARARAGGGRAPDGRSR